MGAANAALYQAATKLHKDSNLCARLMVVVGVANSLAARAARAIELICASVMVGASAAPLWAVPRVLDRALYIALCMME